MKNLFLLFSAFFILTGTAIAQDSIMLSGYAYGDMKDVARGKKLAKGMVKLFDAEGKVLIEESNFTDTEGFHLSVKPEQGYLLKVYDGEGKLLKEGPFGSSVDYYSKNEKMEKGRWVPFEKGRTEYGLAIFTSVSKLPPSKYEPSSSSKSTSVGSMQLPDLMGSLAELRAFSW